MNWLESFFAQTQGSLAAETALATLLAAIVSYLLMRWIDRRHKNSLGMRILRRAASPVFYMIIVVGLRLSLNMLPAQEEAILSLVARLDHLLSIALIIGIVWLLIAGAAGLRAHILRRYDIAVADNLRARKMHTQVNVFYRLVVFFIILIGLAATLMSFEAVDQLGTSLLASAGVTGIIIGFAAQKTLGTLFAGIQIAITQPIRLEDAVVVEGEWGWIEEITLTYVVIRIWDLRRLVVPITYFIETPFQNWTRVSAEIIGTVVLYLDYDVPLEALREEFTRILAHTDLWNQHVQVVQVIDTTEKAQTVRLLMTGKDSPTTWNLRCHVREQLLQWLQAHYPKALPRLRVELGEQQPASG